MFVPLTPIDLKRRAAKLFGRKLAVVDGERRFSYAEFGERTNRLANALVDLGLQRGERVAFIAYNSYPLLEAYFGVLEAGGILLPINIRLAPQEISYILRDAGVSFVFIDPDFAALIDVLETGFERRPKVVWLADPPSGRDEPVYDELLAAASGATPEPIAIDENQVAELFYTSGTTDRPKGVMLTHRNLYLHALASNIAYEANERQIHLHTIPLFHVNGWGTPQGLTAVGGTHVMMRRFDPGETLRLVEAERVTRFLAVPTMLNAILNHPDIERYDLTSLEIVNTGGAPTPPDMVKRAEKALDCRVFGGYGLTETSPVLTLASAKTYLEDQPEEQRVWRQASAGMPVIGVDVRVVDDDDNDVAWNETEVGEIAVRSNVVMKGYWNDPEATEAAIRDGWFYTGDMATVDEEGYLVIVDRKKDIIVSGGENISSVEVEKVLYEHPAVLESAIIGVPDDRWGEIPLALVTLRPGASVPARDLISFCTARMAHFKVPKSIEFVDSLPKGGTGKILKTQLREKYWVGEQKRVH